MTTLDGYRSVGTVPLYTAQVSGNHDYNFYGRYEEVTCSKPRWRVSVPCYVIVTCRSVAWMLLTMIATLAVVGGIMTPQWLVGRTGHYSNGSSTPDPETEPDRPTVGIYNRCTRLQPYGGLISDQCGTYVTGFAMTSHDFPDTWKSALLLFAIAVSLLAVSNMGAVLSLCVQAVCKKSIFTLSGLLQSLAALCLVVGQVIYPAGWGSQVVKDMCGEKAGPFLIEHCQIGWGYYACMGGTVLVFLCALLSIQAEKATSSDKVERQIVDGKHCICGV